MKEEWTTQQVVLELLISHMGTGARAHFYKDKIIPMRIKDLSVKIKTLNL